MQIRHWRVWRVLFAMLALAIGAKVMGQGYGGIEAPGTQRSPWEEQLPTDGSVYVVPNPDSLFQLLELVRNQSVAKELKLTGDEQKALIAAMNAERAIHLSGNPKRLSKPQLMAEREAARAELAKQVYEILPPEKAKRLRELAYQIEVYYIGYANALNRGRLRHASGTHENQAASIDSKVGALETAMKAEVDTVVAKYQRKILEELSTQQRAAAQDCLGAPFPYVASPASNYEK